MSNPKFIAHADMVRDIGPVTRCELDHLRESRERSVPVPELTPGGATERIVRKMESERATVRESYIENRLERLAGRPANDFTLAHTRGKASLDFGRER